MAWDIKLFNQQLFLKFAEQNQNLWYLWVTTVCVKKANYPKCRNTVIRAKFKGLPTHAHAQNHYVWSLVAATPHKTAYFLRHTRVFIFRLVANKMFCVFCFLFFSPSPSLSDEWFHQGATRLDFLYCLSHVSIAMISTETKSVSERKKKG